MVCTKGRIHEVEVAVSPKYACNVVVEAGGYPEFYVRNNPIKFGLAPHGRLFVIFAIPWRMTLTRKRVVILQAGTKLVNGQIVTAGGRMLNVAATGDTLEQAVERAYKGVESVEFADMFYRKDITHR